jgi:hypothetical protein
VDPQQASGRACLRTGGCLGLLAGLVLVGAWVFVIPGWGFSWFNAGVWEAGAPDGPWGDRPGNPRGAMVWSLLGSHKLDGLKREQVIQYLGKPDGARADSGEECPPEKAASFMYRLGEPPGGVRGVTKHDLHLDITFGRRGTVEGVGVWSSD